jgi:hypothetical protein
MTLVKTITDRARKIACGIAPQQIMGMAMLLLAVSLLDRPAAGIPRHISEQWHIPPTTYAVVMTFCAIGILMRPYSAAFMALMLPFVGIIVASIAVANADPQAHYSIPILLGSLYVTILWLAMVGKIKM